MQSGSFHFFLIAKAADKQTERSDAEAKKRNESRRKAKSKVLDAKK
jgi:hypothetical protein